jgi:hypothetical protein
MKLPAAPLGVSFPPERAAAAVTTVLLLLLARRRRRRQQFQTKEDQQFQATLQQPRQRSRSCG